VFLEKISLKNFLCFGNEVHSIDLDPGLTCLIGSNGSGKTATMQALLRMFGVTNEQRRIRPQDFHVGSNEIIARGDTRHLSIEVIVGFPELQANGAESDTSAVPGYFRQMAATDSGDLKCRIRLDASWTDDGTLDGTVDQKLKIVRTMSDSYTEDQCSDLPVAARSRIQVVYVPALRDGASQVAAFLRGRLWRSIPWSDKLQGTLEDAGEALNGSLLAEPGVKAVTDSLLTRWREVHSAGTLANPKFRPIDVRIQEFVRRVDVVFHPDEHKRERPVAELSDGQRSLFHLAMTAALLDVEHLIAQESLDAFGDVELETPDLTVLAVEEPENNLSPFYLSRIVAQLRDVTARTNAQALVSSHSPGVLTRIEPKSVRYFRLDESSQTASVRPIRLPSEDEEASKFLREAVRVFPELYFARFVILGEGSSEEVVLPRLAEAMNLPIDRSFVAVVPLGGRHMQHLWKLLNDLDIPHATLLDLDAGRAGGGLDRIKTATTELIANQIDPAKVFPEAFPAADLDVSEAGFDVARLRRWCTHLRKFGVFYCWPLDLDMSMLLAFPTHYASKEEGARGPSTRGDAVKAVLGKNGDEAKVASLPYEWYRYHFLGHRSKPGTHVSKLSQIANDALAKDAPEELVALLTYVNDSIVEPIFPDMGTQAKPVIGLDSRKDEQSLDPGSATDPKAGRV
jgi:putative ATP-dependent endonuclease of OLD family